MTLTTNPARTGLRHAPAVGAGAEARNPRRRAAWAVAALLGSIVFAAAPPAWAQTVQVSSEVLGAHNALRLQRAYRLIVLKVDADRVVRLDRVFASSPPLSQAAFQQAIAQNIEPRFAVFTYQFTDEQGRTISKIVLLQWVPASSSVQLKMRYAAAAEALKKQLIGLNKVMSANDASDLAEAAMRQALLGP